MRKRLPQFSESELSRIIEMAWEDRTPFDAISASFDVSESQVISLMRTHLKPASFRSWRKRVSNRATKHLATRPAGVGRAYCPTQYKQR
ncbi:MAG: TIGR03643 family protein [Granulosicoccus sp.]